jgi:uncharacterized membrane protein SpoIIM required for sporulation
MCFFIFTDIPVNCKCILRTNFIALYIQDLKKNNIIIIQKNENYFFFFFYFHFIKKIIFITFGTSYIIDI